ncbi:MAG: hypothetical protein ABH872_01210 [Candidatus Omnitrophota bacterium]
MRTLLIHASFGEGHKRAANCLKSFLEADCYDLLDFCHPLIAKLYSFGYIFATGRFCFLWKFIFFLSSNSKVINFMSWAHAGIFANFFKFISRHRPDVVICTHFFPLPLLASLKRRFPFLIGCIVTDLGVHPLWVNKSVDSYFVAHTETRESLVKLGIKEDKIICGFVPLREGFIKEQPEQNIRKKLCIGEKPCIVFVSSLRGSFPFLLGVICDLKEDFHIIVIYGRNKELLKALKKMNYPSLSYYQSYENIWEIFSISSVIVTKPGGLTVFEGLYKKKPFVFTHYIPGQEETNMDFLIAHGLARYAHDRTALVESIRSLSHISSTLSKNYPVEVKDIRIALGEFINRL